MVAQGLGGDIVSSPSRTRCSPAQQRGLRRRQGRPGAQCGLSPPDLGEHGHPGQRVTPYGVVARSRDLRRAGVPSTPRCTRARSRSGRFYAQRTCSSASAAGTWPPRCSPSPAVTSPHHRPAHPRRRRRGRRVSCSNDLCLRIYTHTARGCLFASEVRQIKQFTKEAPWRRLPSVDLLDRVRVRRLRSGCWPRAGGVLAHSYPGAAALQLRAVGGVRVPSGARLVMERSYGSAHLRRAGGRATRRRRLRTRRLRPDRGFLTTYMTASMLVPVAQRSRCPGAAREPQPTGDGPLTFDTWRWLAYCGACLCLEANQFFSSARGRVPLGVWSTSPATGPGRGSDSGPRGASRLARLRHARYVR